eukprot:s3906_g2.t1
MSEQEFKILDGVRRCASTGELIDGKQVLRPLRFFVSETSQHITLASFAGLMQISESQDSALKIVAALRPLVESRLEELKKDKATQETRLVDVFDTKISKDDVMSKKNFDVMKVYGAHLFKGVDERKQLISTTEHRAAVLYLSCCYKLQSVEKNCKQKVKDWAEIQGTRLRWLAAYVVQSVIDVMDQDVEQVDKDREEIFEIFDDDDEGADVEQVDKDREEIFEIFDDDDEGAAEELNKLIAEIDQDLPIAEIEDSSQTDRVATAPDQGIPTEMDLALPALLTDVQMDGALPALLTDVQMDGAEAPCIAASQSIADAGVDRVPSIADAGMDRVPGIADARMVRDRAPLIDPDTVVPLPAGLEAVPLAADGSFAGLRAKQADARVTHRKEWDCVEPRV